MNHRTLLSEEMYRTSFHRSWTHMKSRCNNPSVPEYKNYGGRGITYDCKWESFGGFYDDMFAAYRKGLTLDRIDVNGDYTLDNCRWATMKVQQNNRRNNRRFTINGTTRTLSQWIELSGIKRTTVSQRYHAYKWPIEKALGMKGY